VTVTPPGQSHEIAAPRDLTILIDASGSMSGEPLDLVKAFVHRILTSLQPQDTLQMLAFASRTQPLIDPASPATPECVDRALRALVQLQAGGGTEMAAALREALVPLRADAQRQVLLLSDGYIGFESEVVREVLANLPTGARLHVVGVGSAPNRTLTHCASRAGRGTEQILESGDDVDAAADRMLAGTVAPALLNVRVTGTAVTTVVPERPADVYAGRPAILAVELRPGGGTLRAEALRAGSMEPWMSEVLVVNAEPELAGEAIPAGAYFGREAVEDQEMHLAAAGGEGRDSGAAILRCIETLGMRHRIATRETSLVAIAEEPSVDPREPRVRMRLPVELPAGVSAEGVGLARRFSGAPSRASRKGDGHGFMDVSYAVAQGHSVAFPPMFELPCDARLLRIENDLLIVEIKSPDPTLHLLRPDGEVIVRFNDGSVFMARVDLQLSTAGVPHRKGVTLQLVLRSAEGRPWLTGRPIAIEWKRSGAMYMVLVAGSKR
jgi:Ca-activated chloride channel family protein